MDNKFKTFDPKIQIIKPSLWSSTNYQSNNKSQESYEKKSSSNFNTVFQKSEQRKNWQEPSILQV